MLKRYLTRPRRILALGILILLLVLGSIPRVTGRSTLPADRIGDYPALEAAGRERIPGEQIHCMEVSSLWGTVEYALLPCYELDLPAVPENGNAQWHASLYLAVSCSAPDSLIARLCRMELGGVELEWELGEAVMVSSRAETDPGGIVDIMDRNKLSLEGPFPWGEDPTLRVSLTLATAMGTQEKDLRSTGTFLWTYSIYCLGEEVACCRGEALTGVFTANAS